MAHAAVTERGGWECGNGSKLGCLHPVVLGVMGHTRWRTWIVEGGWVVCAKLPHAKVVDQLIQNIRVPKRLGIADVIVDGVTLRKAQYTSGMSSYWKGTCYTLR